MDPTAEKIDDLLNQGYSVMFRKDEDGSITMSATSDEESFMYRLNPDKSLETHVMSEEKNV